MTNKNEMKMCLLERLTIIFDQEWAGETCNGKKFRQNASVNDKHNATYLRGER